MSEQTQECQLRVSTEDIKILEKALELYENDPCTSALTGTLMSAMLAPKSVEQMKRDAAAAQAQAAEEQRKRKRAVLRLRLLLAEASERPSEFPVTPQ